MPLQPPSITGAEFGMTFNLSEVFPAVAIDTVAETINFNGLTFIQKLTGTFTPANNAVTIWNFTSPQNLPSFILFRCDIQANLIIELSGEIIAFYMPVSKFLLFTPTPLVGSVVWSNIEIDGTSSGGENQTPMAQGVPCNYSLYFSNGAIS